MDRRVAKVKEALDGPSCLTVERYQPAVLRVKGHDPHRRGLDQGREVGRGPPARRGGVRTLTTAAAAREAKSTNVSSSVNSGAPSLPARKKLPTSARWRIGVPWRVREKVHAGAMPSERASAE